ncbi:hypothetical protein Dda_5895 [Drechslerella dactyloides]|uniref:Uncharacterized protein n=1 Tax=Drechslerella dactyloides TaxID=74499 RepID=A0AAD6NHZ7_DREDA|nr:hypothetical protein Dda_5895 [Drechslerella dactyloides]
MQIKALIIASLASYASAAAVDNEKRQFSIPPEAASALSDLPGALSGFNSIIGTAAGGFGSIIAQAGSLFAAIATELPPSVISQLQSQVATLRTEDAPAFYSSVLAQLPPDVRASLSDFAASITAELPTGTNAAPTTAPTTGAITTGSIPTQTGAGATTRAPSTGPASSGAPSSGVTSAGGSRSTSGGSQTVAGGASGTSSGPGASGTNGASNANAASRSYVGYSFVAAAAVLGVALAFRLASPPLSQRIPIARLELSSKNGTPVNDELDGMPSALPPTIHHILSITYSKALLVEFSWSDLSPPPPPNKITTYTLEWDEKPIVLPILEEQRWEWDAPIEVPQEITFDGTKLADRPTPTEDEDTVMLIALIPGTVPHISKVYLRQKHSPTAPPAPSLEDPYDAHAPLEIPVKTLPHTYPLSSEFLGANYRYIADLILADVETSGTKTRGSKRGILHTVFAVRRLEDIDARLNSSSKSGHARSSTKHLTEEKRWIEDEFEISLERLAQARPAAAAAAATAASPSADHTAGNSNSSTVHNTANNNGATPTIKSAISDTPTSPTATAKEWTSQATLASTSLGHRYDDPPVPWPTSPTPRYPAGAYQPSVGSTTVKATSPLLPQQQDGIKAIPPPPAVIAAPTASVQGLGLVRGFEGLGVKDEMRVVTNLPSGDADEDDDEDLFQLPISPRGTQQF